MATVYFLIEIPHGQQSVSTPSPAPLRAVCASLHPRGTAAPAPARSLTDMKLPSFRVREPFTDQESFSGFYMNRLSRVEHSFMSKLCFLCCDEGLSEALILRPSCRGRERAPRRFESLSSSSAIELAPSTRHFFFATFFR